MIEEHDCVVLTHDLSEEGLEAGHIGTEVHVQQGRSGFEVEFVTLAVATLPPTQVHSQRTIRYRYRGHGAR